MTTRVTSARVVGREAELAELEAVLADASAGRPSIAFLAGESGVGKTRLLSEFERRASAGDPPARVIGGDCVELGEGELPYAPIVAALRPLARQHDPVLDGLPAATRAELGALIPGLGGEAASIRQLDGDDAAQARLFEALLSLFDELGRDRTLLLSIEDIHWADRSTRSFLAFLARSLCNERVMVVASYRPDELHRRHPLRPLLAELERNARARRIELLALSRDELREQLTDILGGSPAPELLDRLWSRSEGNPLFTEELLAAGLDGRGSLPPTLRDALMVRVERLSEPAQEVVRYVSKGRRLDTELLADVTSLSPAELSSALREAVAAHILTADEDGWYRFRHALLREVVADDLLPGERSEVHLDLAHALERRAADRGEGAHLAAGIAHHYYAAGDQPAALAASVRAAEAADKVHAHGEAAALSERALELWERVPNAEEVAGIDYIELLRRTAFDVGAGEDLARKEHLLKKALKLMDHQADPLRAADLMEALARTQWTLNRSVDAMETAGHALDLLPDDKPTTEKARLLGWLAKARMLQGKYVAALEVASEAIEAGQAAGDTLAEARARNARGISLVGLGDIEEGLAELRHSLDIARERDNAGEMGSGYSNLADALNAAGRTREALEVVKAGQRVLEDRFRTDWLKTMVAEFMFQLGDWDGAESWMPGSERRQVGTALMYIMLQRINMSLGRGEHAAAREYLNVIDDYVAESSEPQFLGAWGTLSARLDLREGDIESARRAVDEALDRIEFCTEDASRIVRLSAIGVAIEADAAQRARDLGEDPGPALARGEIMLARVRAAAEGDRPVERGWLLTAEAHWSRALGEAEPTLWAEAAEAWERLEWPYETAIARFHEAEAHLAAGDRQGASEGAATALAIARRIGARWLAGEIEGLCARARLQVDGVAGAPATDEDEAEPAVAAEDEEPFGLTPRERQVLTLVSEGRTNREIGDTLYMAEKTASVHVSRILAKLGVRSRTEAAAVAHRLGLDAASGTGRPASGA